MAQSPEPAVSWNAPTWVKVAAVAPAMVDCTGELPSVGALLQPTLVAIA